MEKKMANKNHHNKNVNLNGWMNKLKRIEEKTERLALLSRLGQILNSTLEHHEVGRRAMEAATQLMEAEVGSLLLIEEEKSHLYFEVALGDQEETIKKSNLNIGEGVAGWGAENGDPLTGRSFPSSPPWLTSWPSHWTMPGSTRNWKKCSFKRLNLLPMRSKSGILIRVDIPGGLRCTVWPRPTTSR